MEKINKRAIIVVGTHNIGKSRTIRKHLKPMLGLSVSGHIFNRNGKIGFILSQSFEEAQRDIDAAIKRYGLYDILVIAARPKDEIPSLLREWNEKLNKNGYSVAEVHVERKDSDEHYRGKAREVLRLIDK